MKRGALKQENATKVFLTILFLALLGIAIVYAGEARLMRTLESLTIMDFLLLGLATFRLGRLLAFDRVMDPVRSFAARTVPDPSGAGETVEPKGEGLQQALGQLISCPICAGTWIASFLMYFYIWFPTPTRIFLWMSAAIGLAEVLNALTEALCWTGERNRTWAGQIKGRRIRCSNYSQESKYESHRDFDDRASLD